MTRAVLLYLSTEMRADGTRCFPSYGTIAKALKMHESTVATHVRKAKAGGWLAVTQRKGGRGGRFNMYFPSIPAAVMAERPQDEPHGESMYDQPVGGAPTPLSEADQRVGPESQRVGGGLERVGPVLDRVGGGPTDLVVVPGYNQAVDLSAHARGEDGLTTEEVDVPDDFDPAEYGLDDNKKLFARMTPSDHRWAAAILDRETEYPVAPGYAALSRSSEIDQLPPHRQPELRYRVATNGEAP